MALNDENAEAVVAVCRRLDGLPLAIELAAARSKMLAPSALLVRLKQGLDVLSGGPRDQPERLQTLRAAIAWSYDLLTPEERTAFRHFAVFAGGFRLDAAEAIAWEEQHVNAQIPHLGSSVHLVFDSLSSLVDSSLLRQDDGQDGEPRFAMLETIREYGLEMLATSGVEDAVRRVHAAWYLARAESAEPDKGPAPREWLNVMEAEHPNLRAALEWFIAQGDAAAALRMAGALWGGTDSPVVTGIARIRPLSARD